ncbi:MAG: ATP-binding cassette domain-containing protein [Cytophagales bacterium]
MRKKIMSLLEVNQLIYNYPGEEEILFPDFSINENALIHGPSGVGKTTLLHLIAGLKSIQKGKIIIDGIDLKSLNPKELDRFRAENIGVVYQKSFFLSGLNVLDNILLAGRFQNQNKERKTTAIELLNLFGIESKKNKKVKQLSVGEQQRVSIARAFLNHPKIVIADEPSSALDDKNCEQVLNEMLKISQNFKTTFIVVSHDKRLRPFFNKTIALT